MRTSDLVVFGHRVLLRSAARPVLWAAQGGLGVFVSLLGLGCGPEINEKEEAEVEEQPRSGCGYQDRTITADDELVVGGVDQLIMTFELLYGAATVSWTEEPVAAELNVRIDFDECVIRTPTGEPGPRQTCLEMLRCGFDVHLRLDEGPTFRFNGVLGTGFPAFELWLVEATSQSVQGELPAGLVEGELRPRIKLDVLRGTAQADIEILESRERVVHFESD